MDNLRNSVKLELSLHRLSMTVFITNIYEHPEIKEKMKAIINDNDSFPFKILKSELSKWASEKIKDLNLPGKLMEEVQAMVLLFAKKIVSWAYHVLCLSLDISYLDEIYWTSIGTIDEAKIFDAYWKKHGTLDKLFENDSKRSSKKGPELACIYANEEAVLAFQNSIIKEIQVFFRRNKYKFPGNSIKDDADELMAAYLYYKYGEAYADDNDSDLIVQFILTKQVEMCQLMHACAYSNVVTPIKYFWDFLDDYDKESVADLVPFLTFERVTSRVMNPREEFNDEIDTARSAELIYFLISVMTPNQRNSLFKHYTSQLIECFLMVWPYQDICLKILDEEWFSENCSHISEGILHATLFRMVIDNQSTSCFYRNVFHDILKKTMRNVDKSKKENIFFGENRYPGRFSEASRAIEKFYKRFDVTALNIIVNDKDLEDKRNVMIEMGADKILELKNDNNLELLMSFMEEVLMSNEERKRFIENFKLLDNFLMADKPEIREKVLNWQSV